MSKTGISIAPSQYRECFERFKAEVESPTVKLNFADSVATLSPILATKDIEFVLLGGSPEDLEWRLEILRELFAASPMTSVHCKGAGYNGELFVKNVLAGFST